MIDVKEKYTEYEQSKKRFNDYNNTVEFAEKKGEMKGEKKGLAKGIEKGKSEEKIATAKNLLSMGLLSLEQIAQATGLTLNEIKAL